MRGRRAAVVGERGSSVLSSESEWDRVRVRVVCICVGGRGGRVDRRLMQAGNVQRQAAQLRARLRRVQVQKQHEVVETAAVSDVLSHKEKLLKLDEVSDKSRYPPGTIRY